ncbi:hypothetical protein PIROE2DRAFT_19224, partial [Piromyces sp. E2]
MLIGGEPNYKALQYISANYNINIFHVYGPTETTVICSSKPYSNGNEITIGKPLCNCPMYILDKYMKPVPIGIEGEIVIGGYGVGVGYLNREELTNEKFICDTFNSHEGNEVKMYRSGDIGKWTKDGEVECLGRIDFQVKIRGQRIELTEIENTISELEQIDNSVVLSKRKENNEQYLVAYYISNSEEINGNQIRNYLKEKLPHYMIPNYFISIKEMPVTNNGKLDRRALPEPNINDLIKEEYIAPETETEKEICNIFSQIFKIDVNEIGKKSNFYDLGGDSLNAISIASLIEKKLNVKTNIKSIMNHPVVSDISEYIDELMKSDDISHQVEVIEKRDSKEFPVTSQQLGVYIDSIKNNNSILYNVPMSFKLREDVDIERIKEGFNQLFEKHQILKSKYLKKEVNGKTEIYGYIDDECELNFEEYTNENANSFVRPFDLSSAPLIRVGFIGNEVLLIDMHHIITDGTTGKIVISELNKYYNEGSMNELEVQFGDYAYYINEKMKSGIYNDQIEFYEKMFNEEYETLKINNMNENNENESEIQNITREIDVSISKGINKFVKQYNVSKTAFFLSIYGYVLSKYSGQETIYSSIISANRNNHYLENMIGMFVSTQPILLKFEENDNHSFVEVIKENMTTLMNMYNYQDLSLSELTKCLKLKNVNNTFIYQPKSIINSTSSLNKSIFDNGDINEEIQSLYEDNGSKFDITFNLAEKEDEYLISVDYNTEFFSTYFMEKIVNSFIEMARNVEKFEKM